MFWYDMVVYGCVFVSAYVCICLYMFVYVCVCGVINVCVLCFVLLKKGVHMPAFFVS